MADYSIGNFQIETKNAYDALLKAEATSDRILKAVDKNSDTKISEDELISLVDESSSGIANLGGTTNATDSKQSYLQQQQTLQTQLSALYSKLGKAKDTETMSQIMSQIKSTQAQLDSVMNSYYSTLVQPNPGTNSSVITGGLGGALTGGGGANILGGSDAGTKTANYAIQFDGSDASKMESIMTSNGCQFDSGAWCADFVTFATKMTYGSNSPHDFLNSCPNKASCPEIGSWAESKGIYTTDISKVQPGDFVLYGSRGDERHIGIVTKVNSDGTVDTIEGNTSDDNGGYNGGVVNQHSHVSRWGGFVLMH